MSDFTDNLPAADRRALLRLAADAAVPAEALAVEMVAAYLRLLRDAPGALPRNPLAPLASRVAA